MDGPGDRPYGIALGDQHSWPFRVAGQPEMDWTVDHPRPGTPLRGLFAAWFTISWPFFVTRPSTRPEVQLILHVPHHLHHRRGGGRVRRTDLGGSGSLRGG